MQNPQVIADSLAKLPAFVASTAQTLADNAKHVDWRHAWTLVPTRFKRTPVILGAVALGLGVTWLLNRRSGAST